MNTTLTRFHTAQARGNAYRKALREIHNGAKRTHWMWFVFPQLRGLAKSETARYFGIADRAEAHAYLEDQTLRIRLAECATAVLRHPDTSYFSSTDNRKLRSSMTLFGQVAKDPALANAVLAKFFDGPDQLTLDLLAGKPIVLPASLSRRVAEGRHREEGIRRAQEVLAAAERRRRSNEPWSRNRIATFVGSFGGLSTVAVRQLTDAWMADRQGAMKQAWEAAVDSFDGGYDFDR